MAGSGIVFVISAPSGAGKKTVLDRVFARDGRLAYAVSATTRQPRPGEIDGKDYVFLGETEFRRRIESGAFVEWAEVHGHLYGTLHEQLDRKLESGMDVVVEIDVQGMRSLKALRGDLVTVFMMPPSIEELERRIRVRGANDEASIVLRVSNARMEIDARHEFDYIVVNDVLENAVDDLWAIVRAERRRASRQ
ncbi:MAG: guanylate kinase [Candidatus Hydrogenedentes bacterium]|nr:guanylate kinase [Candidatus Hydrogenedentota bacterium]